MPTFKVIGCPQWNVTIDCHIPLISTFRYHPYVVLRGMVVILNKLTTSKVKIMMSPKDEVALTRGFVRRRFNGIAPPINIITPADPHYHRH